MVKSKEKIKQKKEDQEYNAVLKRLFREYVIPNSGAFLLSIFLAMIAGLTSGASAYLLKPIINDIFLNKEIGRLIFLSVAIIVVFLTRGVCIYFQQLIISKVGSGIIKSLQMRLVKNILKQSQKFFNQNRSGDIQSVIQLQTNAVRSSIDMSVIAVRDVFSVISLVAAMFLTSWKLSLIALIIIPLGIIPLRNLSIRMRRLGESLNNKTGLLMGVVGETMRNVKVVQSYTQEEMELKKIDSAAEHLKQLMIKRQIIFGLTSPLMEALGGLAIGLVILYGGYQLSINNVDAGSFIAFIAAFLLAYEPIKRLGKTNVNIQVGLTAGKRIYRNIDEVSLIKDDSKAVPLNLNKGEVSIKNLSFSYYKNNKNIPSVLDNIHLKIEAGKTIALVGRSGSGKSTLMNMVQRFWDPVSGSIEIDGQNIRDVQLKSLREKIAYVGQEITLFDMSVKENIGYGRVNATQEEIIQAAKNANAHDFIVKLPKGYDTIIGEQGVLLSGGQRQRISIARAMIKQAPILLLDEATSALDTESEKLVQMALEKLMENKTVIVIAHRLSTITNADMICIMDNGKIIETGHHKELIKNTNGMYKKMYEIQFKD